METRTFQIPALVAQTDREVVENALRQLVGVRTVELNHPVKEVTVHWDAPTSWHDIERTLGDLGYRPATEFDGGDEWPDDEDDEF